MPNQLLYPKKNVRGYYVGAKSSHEDFLTKLMLCRGDLNDRNNFRLTSKYDQNMPKHLKTPYKSSNHIKPTFHPRNSCRDKDCSGFSTVSVDSSFSKTGVKLGCVTGRRLEGFGPRGIRGTKRSMAFTGAFTGLSSPRGFFFLKTRPKLRPKQGALIWVLGNIYIYNI